MKDKTVKKVNGKLNNLMEDIQERSDENEFLNMRKKRNANIFFVLVAVIIMILVIISLILTSNDNTEKEQINPVTQTFCRIEFDNIS